MRRTRKDRAAALLTSPPLRTLLEHLGGWTGVLVLNYHRVGDPDRQPWDYALWNASAEELDQQLATLTRCTEVIDPCGLVEAMRAGRGRRVLITFDDGYRDNYEIALPLLRSHSLHATFFLASGFLDRPYAAWWDEIAWMIRHAEDEAYRATAMRLDCDLLPTGISLEPHDHETSIVELIARYKALPDGDGERFLEQLAGATGSGRPGASDMEGLWMTWEMAREILAAGMSIGGHTVTHPVLARLSRERQREEITVCARRLAEELQIEMKWFAYPVGGRDTFTLMTQEILRDAGVELAFSFYGGYARASRWDPLNVPRVHVRPGLDARQLEATIALPQIFARS
jgi:peptidoglycan/xylan/chitin deacetylase (PgdA/CDA1 family)